MTMDQARDRGPEGSGSDDGRTLAGDGEEADAGGPETLMETLSDPDPEADPAESIEEKGEPFDGNHA
ncbi:hypothetical protein HZF05_15770 [Sphingomonas sp. CGMCC 1.13654]|uniref:Uncharacterized protein n=1 Tax=Sphingomonas chungangi TaxID=2683589 RepID=A0A838L8N4_9SPHN|nr:hypothetical protein [Sphingomonas chungangi]MBA2935544.1 hypothetical protein [Sphingomonas chungangi]MVW54237.1 hypothetical protein [Sphingomonas chungangi]